MPLTREQQMVPRIQVSWTGNVWRAFLKASQDPGLATLILDTNRGCGVIRREARPPASPVPPTGIDPLDENDLSWEDYLANRDSWLRIYPPEEVYAAIDSLPPQKLEPAGRASGPAVAGR